MPTYKLYYYNARGYGEAIRLTLKAAGQEFEDLRFKDRDDFMKKKDQFEAGVVPCLEIDGLDGGKVQIRQSQAILRYLGREFGMYGDGTSDKHSQNLQAAEVDTVIDDVVEFRQTMLQIFLEKDETKKADQQKALMEEKLPAFIKKLEEMLKKNQKRQQGGDSSKQVPVHFVGSKLSIADVLVFDVFNALSMTPNLEGVIKGSQLLTDHAKAVTQNAKIAKWLTDRPVTEH